MDVEQQSVYGKISGAVRRAKSLEYYEQYREVFEELCDRPLGLDGIARELMSRGIPKISGATQWFPGDVRTALSRLGLEPYFARKAQEMVAGRSTEA